MKLKGTHWLLVDADNINILDVSVRKIKNTESLVVASKETGLVTNAGKTK